MSPSTEMAIAKPAALPANIANEPYMNQRQLDFFRQRLEALKEEAHVHIQSAQAALSQRIELNDEADLAQHEEESRLALRIIDRESKLLTKIAAALERVRSGEYGYCQESGEPIGIARLLIRPTAEYCAEIKNQMEEREKHYGKHR